MIKVVVFDRKKLMSNCKVYINGKNYEFEHLDKICTKDRKMSGSVLRQTNASRKVGLMCGML